MPRCSYKLAHHALQEFDRSMLQSLYHELYANANLFSLLHFSLHCMALFLAPPPSIFHCHTLPQVMAPFPTPVATGSPFLSLAISPCSTLPERCSPSLPSSTPAATTVSPPWTVTLFYYICLGLSLSAMGNRSFFHSSCHCLSAMDSHSLLNQLSISAMNNHSYSHSSYYGLSLSTTDRRPIPTAITADPPFLWLSIVFYPLLTCVNQSLNVDVKVVELPCWEHYI